jgi:hypothetical protein
MEHADEPAIAADEAYIEGLARLLALGQAPEEKLRAERTRQRQLAEHYRRGGDTSLADAHASLAERADLLLRPELSAPETGPSDSIDHGEDGLSIGER